MLIVAVGVFGFKLLVVAGLGGVAVSVFVMVEAKLLMTVDFTVVLV